MKPIWTLFLQAAKVNLIKCFLVLFFFLSQAAGARELTDALGEKVQLPDQPHRIVTLAPSLGEIVADLSEGKTDRIAGVSEFSDYPPSLKQIESIGPYSRVNLEKIAALKPDLILATADGNARDQIEHLRELKLSVVVVKSANFRDVEDSIRLIARAMNEEKRAQKMIADLTAGLASFEKRRQARAQAGLVPPRAILQLDANPLMVVGKAAFLNEALERVGAINVYGDVTTAYPKPALEDAIRRDPDVILILGMGGNLAVFEKAAKDWMRFLKMKAVKSKKVQVITADTLLRPTRRILEGMNLLEKAIYGEKP